LIIKWEKEKENLNILLLTGMNIVLHYFRFKRDNVSFLKKTNYLKKKHNTTNFTLSRLVEKKLTQCIKK